MVLRCSGTGRYRKSKHSQDGFVSMMASLA